MCKKIFYLILSIVINIPFAIYAQEEIGVVTYIDSGAVYEYPLGTGMIHVSSLVKGLNAYTDINWYNKYGTTSRFIEKAIYPQTSKSNRNEQVSDLKIIVNDKDGCSVLRDGDRVKLLLDTQLEQIDSVTCFLKVKNYYGGNTYRKVKLDKNYAFNLRQEIFDNYTFLKFANDKYAYRDSFLHPDSCWINVTVRGNTKDGIQKTIVLESSQLTLAVLPKEPRIEIIKTGEEDWEGVPVPYAIIKLDSENFDNGLVFVVQRPPAIEYIDTAFTSDFTDTTYTVYLGEWGDKIYCSVFNKYGTYRSDCVCPTYTSVINPIESGMDIIIDRRILKIQSPNALDVYLYSMDGRQIESVADVSSYTKELLPGLYLVKIIDKVSKQVITKKIIVK